jgi:hypothetical protein
MSEASRKKVSDRLANLHRAVLVFVNYQSFLGEYNKTFTRRKSTLVLV